MLESVIRNWTVSPLALNTFGYLYAFLQSSSDIHGSVTLLSNFDVGPFDIIPPCMAPQPLTRNLVSAPKFVSVGLGKYRAFASFLITMGSLNSIMAKSLS